MAVVVACALAFSSTAGASQDLPSAKVNDGSGSVTTDPRPPGTEAAPPRASRIINGAEAPEGQFPWLGSMQRNGVHQCGTSVIAATWVVTAAHCFFDEQGTQTVTTANVSVRLGSNSRSSGGRVHQVSRIIIHPSYDRSSLHNDVAVMQLATSTVQTPITMSATSADDTILASTGAQVFVAGWGNTNPGPAPGYSSPERLRYTDLFIQNESVCRDSSFVAYTATSVCAWNTASGSCQGDSGGPLMSYRNGSVFLVGLVSYGKFDAAGRKCANGTYATVYTRVSSFDDWVENHTEAGPHASEDALIRQTHRDFIGREPTSAELDGWRHQLASQVWTWDMIGEFTRSEPWEAQARSSARLYRATFLRDPDAAGLGYWVTQRRAGRSLTWQSNFFASSPEFRARYGTLTNSQFVDRIYQNVLGRAADAAGHGFWLVKLNAGTTRGRMLAEFSEVAEHRRNTDARVDAIAMSFAMLRAVPTADQLAWMVTQPRRNMAKWLLNSPTYAARFR